MSNKENLDDEQCIAIPCEVPFVVDKDKAEDFNNLPPSELDFSILDKLNIKREE